MIHLYLWAMLWVWDTVSHPSATVVNEAKLAAQRAFNEQNYLLAATQFKKVSDASIFSDPAVRLNMANAYFLAGEHELADENYLILTRVSDPKLAAIANARLGMTALGRKDTSTALDRLKEAILLDRGNRVIIADFEVLRSRFSGIVEPAADSMEKPPEPDSLPKPDTGLPAPQVDNAVVELSDRRDQLLQNLDRINMSEEQARSVLDAMKTNERQYIYQLRRLGARTNTTSAKKVEW